MNNAELIKALKDAEGYIKYVAPSCIASDEAKEAIRAAAATLKAAEKRIAELMPKEGEWQWLSSTYDRVPCEMRYVCSVCHHQEITHYDKPWKHYCPNCGARMKGESNGN